MFRHAADAKAMQVFLSEWWLAISILFMIAGGISLWRAFATWRK
jgi:hypothetical protein